MLADPMFLGGEVLLKLCSERLGTRIDASNSAFRGSPVAAGDFVFQIEENKVEETENQETNKPRQTTTLLSPSNTEGAEEKKLSVEISD